MMRRGTNQRWNFGMRGTVENGVCMRGRGERNIDFVWCV